MTITNEGVDEKFSEYVESRLQEWAEWYSRERSGLGYPTRSMEYIFMTVGIVPKSKGIKTSPSNANAEEIEKLIYEMWKQNNILANSLRHFYFSHGSLRAKANLLNISYVQFKFYVDMARQWLAGRLSATRS